MKENYYVGLDLGTGSLGWAVTDENYNVLREHGKDLWGVRLFESAQTAEKRRQFRGSRRRIQRRNHRIELLQEIFADAINEIDDGFFLRMKESKYVPEDKLDIEGQCPELPYALFVDKNYTDKDYHCQFPTIYHLRRYLMKTQDTPDIRLVYLAIHHIMKHRGHALFTGSLEKIKNFNEVFRQLIDEIIAEELEFSIYPDQEMNDKIESILKNEKLTKLQKKMQLRKVTGAKTRSEKAVFDLLCGATVKVSDIFNNEEFDNIEHSKISFSDFKYDEYQVSLESDLNELFNIIRLAKAVYDWSVFVKLLGEYDSISEAKIAIYEKHRQDLTKLKKTVKCELGIEAYKDFFEKTEDKYNNYVAYIGMTKKNGKKNPINGVKCTKEDFYKCLEKAIVEKLPESEDKRYIKEEIDKGDFLPMQTSKDNGILPNQVHLYELNAIIENLEDRIPVLKEYKDKIISIFNFRIPYYIGPLNGVVKNGSKTNWVVRRAETEGQKIYPWNFEDVVNFEESAEKFIRRMTNKCTYLSEEDVLPKYSLLYSKFIVLNELNNVRIDGQLLPVSLKQKIYSDLFEHNRRVTIKKLKNYLANNGYGKNVDITGTDGDFKGSLTAYHDFKEKLTDVQLSNEQKEKIILNITLFCEDKKMLKARLHSLFPQLTDNQCKALCGLSYKGWGRLSEKLLSGIESCNPETGEMCTIIGALWETEDNFMQLLGAKYKYIDEIERINNLQYIDKITYDVVDKMYVSPSVKRQIWQTLQVLQEINGVLREAPKRIFVEMAREKTVSKRTISRRKSLIELYKKCKEDEREFASELEVKEDNQLKSDRLFLYYTQKGRCMYSGEIIDIGELFDRNKYDVDHIYPQSKTMDDSIDNRVLVKKKLNAEKSDIYPINAKIRSNMMPFWKSLLDGGFISKEKYSRLTRSSEFEPDELAGFIQRQLVETRQSTKALAAILKQIYPKTDIVYVKAGIVSQFRQDFGIIKVRDMNDMHHAKDAYLNIVCGNAYHTKFTKNPMMYIKNNPGRTYNLRKMFTSEYDIRDGITGCVAWIAGSKGTISTVKNTLKKNSVLVTRRNYEVKGELFDQQLMKKGKGQAAIKDSDSRLRVIKKYGGYNKVSGAYFMLVESDGKNGKRIRSIEYVPLYLKNKIEKSDISKIEYLQSERSLKNPKIIINKIKIDTLFKVDGFYMYLSGRSENSLIFKGANQLVLGDEDMLTLKKVCKFIKERADNKNVEITNWEGVIAQDLINLYDTFTKKLLETVYSIKLDYGKLLEDNKQVFIELSDEDKCIVLYEILHLFQCNSTKSDLRLINGAHYAGVLKMTSNISKCNQISIINQSPTGIFQQEIDLKRVK